MKRASIDLGTNTCLLLIQDGSTPSATVLHDESNIVRLGEGVSSSHELKAEAMKRAIDCLLRYAELVSAQGLKPDQVVAVATAQARNARNATDFFAEVKSKTGFQFRILTGDEEARATFLGAKLPDHSVQGTVVIDIGGGSTELVTMSTNAKDFSPAMLGRSLDIGAVKLTELFLHSDPVTDVEFWSCEAAIDDALSTMKDWRAEIQNQGNSAPRLIAVAGTAVTLAMLQAGLEKFDPAVINELTLTQGDAHRLVEELKWRSVAERKQMPGMEAKRADVILAGALIFWRAMEVLDFKEVRISTRGLRYGVFEL